MLLGQFERTLDEKSRFALPPDLRSGLGPGAVMTRSFDRCLCIYSATRWESLARAIDDLPQVRAEVRLLARSMFGGAVPCDYDKQGRVSVPAFLRDHAGIATEIVAVGVGDRVEIWAKDAWQQEQARFESEGARLAEAMTIS